MVRHRSITVVMTHTYTVVSLCLSYLCHALCRPSHFHAHWFML